MMIQPGVTIAVCPDPHDAPVALHKAQNLAAQLDLPLTPEVPNTPESPDACRNFEMVLTVRPDRLEIRWATHPRTRPIYSDFSRTHPGSSNQLLAKAIGLKTIRTPPGSSRGSSPGSPLHVVDATAGLGEDSWLLACLGCRVTAVERCPILVVLLRDAVARAALFNPAAAQRINIITADAIDWLSCLPSDPAAQPDVIYLDPMFPLKTKSALPPIQARWLRRLVGEDPDASELFAVARRTAQRRVVVKRPLHAAPLAGQPPIISHKGKSIRYDVYTPASTDSHM